MTVPRIVGDPVAVPTPATLKLYAGDWARFVAWCREQSRPALPASSETLAAYLIATAPTLSRGTLGRQRAAIGAMHRHAGQPTPLLTPAIHKVLRQTAKPKPVARSAPTTASLVRVAQTCPRDLRGLRDRALLLLVAATRRIKRRKGSEDGCAEAADGIGAGGVPRLYLLALDAEQVRFTATGLVLALRTQLDEAAPSRTVTLTRATNAIICPVRALEDWLRSAETAFGPVFRKVDRWGNVEHGRLAPDAWYRILAWRSGNSARAAPAQTDR